MLVEQTEKSLNETRYRLDKKAQELGAVEDVRAQLEIDLHSVKTQLKKEREEVSRDLIYSSSRLKFTSGPCEQLLMSSLQ